MAIPGQDPAGDEQVFDDLQADAVGPHLILVTDNFENVAEIAVCKFLRGWQSYGLKPCYFVHCMCLYIFLQLFVRRNVP